MPAADTPRCVKCHHPLWTTELADGRWACQRCETDTALYLRALPALFRRIDQATALTKASRGADRGGSPAVDAPVPLSLTVLDLTAKGGAVTLLQAIEDSWRTVRGRPMGATRHHADIGGACEFLTYNLRWACERYEDVGYDLRVIRQLHDRIKSLDDGEPAPKRFTVYCRAAGCGGEMRITLTTGHAACPECGDGYDRDQLTRLDSQYGPNPEAHAAA